MMLHHVVEKRVYILSLVIVLLNSCLNTYCYFQTLFIPIQHSIQLISSNFFMGSLLAASAKIYLLAYCFKILVEKMGYWITYKKALSMLLVTAILPVVFSPIFKLLMLDYLISEINTSVKKTLYWIDLSFNLVGFIYFIQALKKEFKFTTRRAFFTTLFIGMMFFFTTSPFYGIEL